MHHNTTNETLYNNLVSFSKIFKDIKDTFIILLIEENKVFKDMWAITL